MQTIIIASLYCLQQQTQLFHLSIKGFVLDFQK